MFTINRTPILILSAPRTGSTVLGEYIKQHCANKSIPYFAEPDYEVDTMDRFTNFFSKSTYFILKMHYSHLYRYSTEIQNFLLTDSQVYRIRIQRRSVNSQVASWYIALCRDNHWHFKSNTQPNDKIEIDLYKIEYCIGWIKYCNQILAECTLPFDQNLIYEDLPEMTNLGYVKTPEPSNYLEILDAVNSLNYLN